MIMGCVKNPRKSKWFLVCFRPEEALKPNSGSERNTLNQNILFALSNEKQPDSCPANNIDGGKSDRRRFHRVFKTIFSNTASSLSKKKRNKRSGKDTCTNISSKFEKIFNTPSEKKSKSLLSSLESVSSSSQYSSIFSSPRGYSIRSSSSSSSISSIVSNSRSGSGRRQTCMVDLKELKPNKTIQTQKKKEDGKFSTEIGLYFMLICLVGLIFWGKAFAIFCTSTCLFLVPCIFKGVALEEKDDDSISISVDTDSDEYKKKVIMEGLLERNYPRKL